MHLSSATLIATVLRSHSYGSHRKGDHQRPHLEEEAGKTSSILQGRHGRGTCRKQQHSRMSSIPSLRCRIWQHSSIYKDSELNNLECRQTIKAGHEEQFRGKTSAAPSETRAVHRLLRSSRKCIWKVKQRRQFRAGTYCKTCPEHKKMRCRGQKPNATAAGEPLRDCW